MFNLTKLENNIYYYENVYNNPSAFLIDIENKVFWEDWYASDSDILYGKTAGTNYPLPNEIFNFIKENILKCLDHYANETGNSFGWIPDHYRIQKYNLNAYMGPHTDSTDKTAIHSPTISAVMYLNDNYNGGELVFPKQNITIKPSAGSVIVFPSYPPYYHDPQPVISGSKYMCPVFCYKERF
jgi:hypothetical protein